MAVEMRLYEHPDFDQAIRAARDHIAQPGLTLQLIEKDYCVIETLRAVARHQKRSMPRIEAARMG